MGFSRGLLVVLALVCTALGRPARVAAQVVVGEVVEQGSLQPLTGAFVILEDEQGVRSGGVLTGRDGRFRLRGGTGRYRLVVEMLGYAGTRTEPFDLTPGVTLERRIEMPVQAVTLEGIRAETGERCHRRPGAGASTARLWDEARKALEVARWSLRQGVLQFQVTEHEREIDARTMKVLSQTERPRQVFDNSSPYRSIPARRLHEHGYVSRAADGMFDYWLPDADVLLSDLFLETHCFAVAEAPADEPELIGLRFQPVPEREVPEISGVLWLERGTSELRRLEVTYEDLPQPARPWPQVGGRVDFERLSTGVWIVRRWYIRMPLTLRRVGGYGMPGAELELATLLEQGAEVRAVRTRSGELLAEAAGATLYGTATRADGTPLAGATLEVEGLEERTTTGDDGVFRLSGLGAGTYAVRLTHPDLELAGIGPLDRLVDVVEGRAVRLSLEAPTTARRAAELCDEWGAPDSHVLVYGRVVSGRDAAVPGAVVRLRGGGSERRLAADSAGVYRACLPRVAMPARLAAVGEAGLLAPIESLDGATIPFESRGFVRADLPLVASSAVARRGSWSNAILGRAVDAETGEPVAGVSLFLRDESGASVGAAVTDDAGRFRIPHPRRGGGDRFVLAAEHIAYGALSRDISFETGDELTVDVRLSPRPLELEPIVVRERRRGLLVDVGFYERREQGQGTAIERVEIERRVPSNVTDLFRGMVGLRVVQLDLSGTEWDIRFSGSARALAGREGECQPAIWLDGNLIRPAGPPRFDPYTGRYIQVPLSGAVNPANLEAVEVFRHASEVPPRYAAGAPCGVVLLWTRQAK